MKKIFAKSQTDEENVSQSFYSQKYIWKFCET